MWKTVIAFVWECIVGKDVRPGKALQLHKIRLLFFLVFCISFGYSYHVTKRVNTYFNAYQQLEVKYSRLKQKNHDLEEENRKLTDALIQHTRTHHQQPLRGKTMQVDDGSYR